MPHSNLSSPSLPSLSCSLTHSHIRMCNCLQPSECSRWTLAYWGGGVCVRESREDGGGGGETGSVCFVWSHGARAAFPTRPRCMLGKADCWTTVNPFSMENIWLKWVKVCSYVCADLWSIRSTFISQWLCSAANWKAQATFFIHLDVQEQPNSLFQPNLEHLLK